ncbi:MAG: ATP-binding protein [Paludibacteraceae bacterium]|nr:ATP-binding protein [Paludibacteraceae bacterium]
MTAQELLPIVAEQKEEFLSEDFSPLCPRSEQEQIDLNSRLAQVVIGVRRSGKSTICRKALREAGVKAAYINFDDERLEKAQSADLNAILEALYIVYGDFQYLLLDEVQNVEGWPLFVNRLLRQNMHLLVTGSNAKLLSNELTTHLTGRHHKISLYPFSFDEYTKIKHIDTTALTTKGQAEIKRTLNEYLMQGGFPELINERNRQDYIMGLLDAIIKRDITKRFNVRYPEVLQRLATYLIDNFAQEYNATALAEMLGVSDHTIDTYCHYLQEAFLLLSIHKFSYKSRDRIRGEKLYVVDNAFISERLNTFSTENMGWRLENAVYVELLHRAGVRYADVFYYRDRSFEVDFLVAKNGVVEELYQVCYDMTSAKTRKREIKSMLQGAKKFRCENLTIITFSEQETILQDNYTIKVIPASQWLLSK